MADIDAADALPSLLADPRFVNMPRLILGGGSNIVLRDSFHGLVVRMCNKGISVDAQDEQFIYVLAEAGEVWHDFVLWTLSNDLPGLENLSLIPGTVGAAPIQNIGAYGAEVMEFIDRVDYLDTQSLQFSSVAGTDCQFSYRDSVFKRALRERAIITRVRFRLPRQWHARLNYADLKLELERSQITTPDAKQISNAVIAVRQRKLPDPARIGNAGSFFKNPIVPLSVYEALKLRFPNLVAYPVDAASMKLAAGWLIDQCGWKGRALGRAGVYEKQALVLVNLGGACGADIVALAQAIQTSVHQTFGVSLEAEPVFV